MSARADKLISRTKQQVGSILFVISHDIEGFFGIVDCIGTLYISELIQFGTCYEIKNGQHLALRRFFSRTVEGPMKVA